VAAPSQPQAVRLTVDGIGEAAIAGEDEETTDVSGGDRTIRRTHGGSHAGTVGSWGRPFIILRIVVSGYSTKQPCSYSNALFGWCVDKCSST
jgi:hypothetical protein